MPDATYDVTPDQSHEGAPCPDCGAFERTVWGWVRSQGDARAVYYARWQINHRERGLRLLVSLGGWGREEDEQDRKAVAFDCQVQEGGRLPAFTPLDAGGLAWSEKAFLGEKLAVADAPPALIDEARAIAERIVQQDDRVRAFVTRGGRDTRQAAEVLERAHAKLNDSDDVGAEVDATRALGHDPELWDAYFLRGWARARAEQHEGAVADLETYLARAPKGKHAPRAEKILRLARSKRGG
ncbi:MAG: hypothetical protein M9894_07290 [Planctomycetes bacterium]|nr:hypothetical protein [Planctomycetota bacterium]